MYMFKEVDQPRAEVSPGSLAAAEERVEHRCIFSGIIIATEQVITSAARDRPHFIFSAIIQKFWQSLWECPKAAGHIKKEHAILWKPRSGWEYGYNLLLAWLM